MSTSSPSTDKPHPAPVDDFFTSYRPQSTSDSEPPIIESPSVLDHSPKECGLSWSSRIVLAITIAIAGFCLSMANRDSPIRQTAIGAAAANLVEGPTTATTPIQDIEVFDKVVGRNPQLSEAERAALPTPDPATWKILSLEMTKDSGNRLWIKLARDPVWIAEVGAQSGESFYLFLPEMGAVGDARVLSISPAPELKAGSGAIVTGTFAHEADPEAKILRVEFADGTVIKGVTDNHPFWSVDQQDFVPVGELKRGDQVRTNEGIVRITSINSRNPNPGEMLYNLEVHGEHVYQVTPAGVLVHNSCAQYGVHWTTIKNADSIDADGIIRASNDLVWMETADSLSQLKRVLQRGGTGTGARGNNVAIIVDLSDRAGLDKLRPRIVGGGGAAFRLPDGLQVTGPGGRGLTWWNNTGANREITKIIDFIRQGRTSY